MRINANIAAISASRNPLASNEQLNRSLDRSTPGVRGPRATDDTAGLSLTEGLLAALRGNTQAQRNAQDGISYLQTAEVALTDVRGLLQRLRDLAVQVANGGDDAGRSAATEAGRILDEIRSIGDRTTFSGVAVFADYSAHPLAFPATARSGEALATIAQDIRLDPSTDGVFASGLAVDLSSPAAAAGSIGSIDGATGDVTRLQTSLGAAQDRLELTVANLGVAVENLTASMSRLTEVGAAAEIVEITRGQIVGQPRTALQAQATTPPASMLLLLQG